MGTTNTAAEVAAAVRAGNTKAGDLVEQHLAAITARESEIHAFNHVMADEARAAAAQVDAVAARGDDPGPLAGVTVALKGYRTHPYSWMDLRQAHFE